MISKQYIVDENHHDLRVDKVLTGIFPDESRSQIQKWLRNEHVKANNRLVKANYKCQKDDVINIYVPKPQQVEIESEDIPLDVIYEDEDLIVILKPRGMIIHPTQDQTNGTLVNALLNHSKLLSKIGGPERPGIVHRLDKDTTGLLVVAKNDETHLDLVKQFKNKQVERIYEAIVHGVIPHENGVIDAPIGRNPKSRLLMDVVDNGKEAITHFQVLERYESYTYIICKLETGRMHQIRVHMNYIGHPLVGDPKYAEHQNTFKHEGQALYAKKLCFTHPKTDEYLVFEVNKPDYFQHILDEIKER